MKKLIFSSSSLNGTTIFSIKIVPYFKTAKRYAHSYTEKTRFKVVFVAFKTLKASWEYNYITTRFSVS